MRKTLPALALFVLTTGFSLPLAAALASAPMSKDGLTIDLLSVDRKGSVLTVKWAVRNSGKEKASFVFVLTHSATTYVLDEENGTKYYVLTDKEGHVLASQDKWFSGSGYVISDSIEPDKTMRYWMKLPAPPPAVKTINLVFTDTEPFEGIAITDK